MGIQVSQSFIHWNYFLALENDLAQVSRYIEFDKKNFKTYSIELSHLLLASASEVDVITKGICGFLEPTTRAENINDYQAIILRKLPELVRETIYVPRFSLTLKPWSNWKNNKKPLWWGSYNKVKHERSVYFAEANLKNVLNSMGGLLVVTFYFYKLKFQSEGVINNNKDVNDKLGQILGSSLNFMKLQDDYYHEVIWTG
jgi:hypothetical protein